MALYYRVSAYLFVETFHGKGASSYQTICQVIVDGNNQYFCQPLLGLVESIFISARGEALKSDILKDTIKL